MDKIQTRNNVANVKLNNYKIIKSFKEYAIKIFKIGLSWRQNSGFCFTLRKNNN